MDMPNSKQYPLQLCLIKYEIQINCGFAAKSDLHVSTQQNLQKLSSEINNFKTKKTAIFS